MNKRFRPSPDRKKRDHAGEAIHNIVRALNDLDSMRQGLVDASYNLRIAVDNAPSYVRQDFKTFWMSGGCTQAQFREWLIEKRPRVPVLKRQHLRLVSNQQARERNGLVRKRLAGPDDGPTAA